MGKGETVHVGNRGISVAEQKLTAVSVEAVAWSEEPCGQRIRRRPSRRPASSRGRFRRTGGLRALDSLQGDKDEDGEEDGQHSEACCRRWPRVLNGVELRRHSGDWGNLAEGV